MGTGETTEVDDPDLFWAAFRDATAALERAGVAHAVIGSAAHTAYGKESPLEDVDVLIRPGDAEAALAALRRAGFETERTDPSWLYQGRRDGVLVDVVFSPSRGFALTDDLIERRRRAAIGGTEAWMLAPEDQVTLELASDAEETPTHWRTALEILRRQPIDWSRLEPRGEDGRSRLVALLLYARTEGIAVPDDVVTRLASGGVPA